MDRRERLARREQIEDGRRKLEVEAQDYREAIAMATGGWEPRSTGIAGDLRMESFRESLRQPSATDSTGVVQCKEYLVELELALEDRGWKRLIAMADTEFSRYGIQQIMLISRLYFIKNPLIRRSVQVCAYYVFGRGVEISSPDEIANETLQRFLAENIVELGQSALVQKDEALHTDGNLFWAFFSDQSTGTTIVRTIDSTEVDEIVCSPNDHGAPWFYRRQWNEQTIRNGSIVPKMRNAWYVALGARDSSEAMGIVASGKFNGVEFAQDAMGQPVFVHHRKRGGLPKWHFGVPEVYGAIDWARAVRSFYEDWATKQRKLSNITQTFETEGGAPAIAAAKQVMATTLANDMMSIETNPAPVTASTFISGPGNKITNLRTGGMMDSPESARRLVLMVAAHFGIPETFLGDASVGSLATSQSLDRPTELKFLERQEMWREDLQVICGEALGRSQRAPNGRMREAERAGEPIRIEVNFPSVLEHDVASRVRAIVEAMTLNGYQAVGIDERVGIGMLLSELGYEDVQPLLNLMFPPEKYDSTMDRTINVDANRVMTRDPEGVTATAREAQLLRAVTELRRAMQIAEGRMRADEGRRPNGHA